MRQVEVDERELLGETTFRKLRLNSPAGGWFPALQDFFWHVTRSNHPYTNLFLSPRLKRISVRLSVSWSCYGAPSEFLPAVASAISALPPSALQSIQVGCEEPWIALKDLVSSVILRCGPSLEGLSSLIPLSDEAIDHLIRLPHLRTWRVTVPPPNHSASPSPLVFPPLTEFSLLGGAAHGWFSLFKCLEHGVSATQGATPLSRLKESLQFLNIENPPRLIIDTPFASTIQIFRNLVILGMRVNCHDDDNGDQCTFKLNNNDVTELAMALSQLEIFFLGIPCSKNTCHATVACLLAISVHCVKLRELELHFNTRSIVDDLKTILEDSQYEELRSLPRCPLSCLGVWKIPLVVDEPDLEAVVHGMVKVFPSLEHFQQAPYNFGWEKLSERISVLRGSDVSDSLSVSETLNFHFGEPAKLIPALGWFQTP